MRDTAKSCSRFVGGCTQQILGAAGGGDEALLQHYASLREEVELYVALDVVWRFEFDWGIDVRLGHR